MFVTDKFVFLHMVKTGGHSIISTLEGQMIGYHKPRREIPEKYSNLPIVGIVRNPFDWYVSLYYHCLNWVYPMKTPMFLNFVLNFKKHNFNDAITKLIDTSWMTDLDKKTALDNFPSENTNHWRSDNMLKSDFESYINGDIGFLTWTFKHMFELHGFDFGVTYCKLETLDSDWGKFVEYKNRPFPEYNTLFQSHNSICGKVEEPRERGHSKYYNKELIDLIKRKDNEYISKFYPELI
jgi:hypothetical protein